MKRFLFLLLAVNGIAVPCANGAVSDEDIEQLREQIAALSQRLEELAAENADLRRAQDQASTAIADVQTSVAKVQEADFPVSQESWSDRVALNGDFRYRYERIDAEGSSSRRRNRIRARICSTNSNWSNTSTSISLINHHRTIDNTVTHRWIDTWCYVA